MKKLLFATAVALASIGSLSFAADQADITIMKAKLLPIVNLILNSPDYTNQQKSLVKNMIKGCSENNTNEVIKSACKLIYEETDEEILQEKKKTQEEALADLKTEYDIKYTEYHGLMLSSEFIKSDKVRERVGELREELLALDRKIGET
ncbi:MAG: hypothetical protein LBG59_02425 [Candidatus Peribacteria bacterium]|jgi:Skp family chaperone for outer membrane proteins|nr:hypothetical protein [Candidatus Peribacteria bacterium]